MRALFIGDEVGNAPAGHLAERLPTLRSELALDVVVAGAENCGGPTGAGRAVRLLALPEVLRPLNLAEGVFGRGVVAIDVDGQPRPGARPTWA